jgi:hypothetical protein
MNDGVRAFLDYFNSVPDDVKNTDQELDGVSATIRTRIAAGDSDHQIALDLFEAADISHPEDRHNLPTGDTKKLILNYFEYLAKSARMAN